VERWFGPVLKGTKGSNDCQLLQHLGPLTGFYGNPDRAKREGSWQLLQHLSTLSLSEWVCMGDFNEIFDNSEKVGGAWRQEVQMERFRLTIQCCQLGDLGFRGSKYTWSNKREAGGFIKESLDKAMSTTSWCGHFPDMWVEVLAACSSDHMPICLHLLSSHKPICRIRSFKYEDCWDIDSECAEVVKAIWGDGTRAAPGGDEMKQLLGKCQQALEDWSSNKYRAMGLSVKRLTRRLEVLQRSEHPSNLATIAELQQEIDQLLEMEDT
jgi:hypothetical protein